MTHMTKPKYHHGDLRKSLLAATIEMINQHGVEQITMRKLSEWVGVSRTAAYRHFSDKSDLLTATAIEGFKQFSQELNQARTDTSIDSRTRFKNMGQAYIQFAIDNAAYYRLMFSDSAVQKNEVLQQASESAFYELVAMLEILQNSQLIICDDLKMQASFIWSLMHGLSSLIIDNKLHADIDVTQLTLFLDEKIEKSLSE